MNKRERIETIILYVVFICYILLLIKMLFLSRTSLAELFDSERFFSRSINLIPFDTISLYVSSGSAAITRFAFSNVVGNIAVFIPLGMYLLLFKKDKRIAVNLLLIFIASVSAELIQWVFGLGAADIDDVILNCLGGLLGILGYKLLLLLLHDQQKVRTAGAIVSVIGLPFILYLLFIVQMRF